MTYRGQQSACSTAQIAHIAEYLWLFMPGGQGRKEHRMACYARSAVLAATLGALDMPRAFGAAYSRSLPAI
jgi:hypothetical protein